MRTLLQDLRYAVRQLRKSPGFTLAAVLTLTIGIGANTALFSSMDAVVMHPLVVPQLDRVMAVSEEQDGRYHWVTLGNFEDWGHQSRSFEQMAAFGPADMSMTGAGDAAHVEAARTSANFFSVLQTPALLGRAFLASDAQPGRDDVVVLNYGFWLRQFAGDPKVLGRKIELDQRPYTVVGVMPKTMQYPPATDLFVPFAPTPQQLQNRSDHNYEVIGRLRDGVTAMQAQAEMRTIAEHLSKAYPATNARWSVHVETLLDNMNGPYTPRYYKLIMGATLFVLLVVCANLANLQFARGIARRPEIAMRTALGARRWRIIRQLLTENILLGVGGAAGGMVFAGLYLHIILISMPARVARYMPGWSNTSLNGRALAFTTLLALAAGVVSGFAPALEALRMNLVDQLKSGSRGSTGTGRTHRLRNIFAVTQIAFAVALVIGASLMAKGMDALLHIADVYHPDKVLRFTVTLPAARYDTPEKRGAWYAASLDKLRALPGVTHAELAAALPYSDMGWVRDCAIENRPVVPGKFQSAFQLPVSEGYFSAFHIPIVAGRGFGQSDALGSVPVAVVSRKFVNQYFPGENPIGRRIRMGAGTGDHEPWLTIAGVAEETNYSLWDDRINPAVYLDAAQLPPPNENYVVMTEGNPAALASAVRKALAGIDPGLPLEAVETWQLLLHEQLTGLIYTAAMLGVDALIALLLAAIGIFGVMANQVGERTREIGVRLAMGARREDVLAMLLRRAGWLTAAGVGSGLVLAFLLAYGVASLLRGVRPDDPVVFSAITAAVTIIAVGSSWIPARRAARIEPMVALRDE
jgi:putative ABC transport system permease protein